MAINQQDSSLIEEIEKIPTLKDTRLKDYKNKRAKEIQFISIGFKLGLHGKYSFTIF